MYRVNPSATNLLKQESIQLNNRLENKNEYIDEALLDRVTGVHCRRGESNSAQDGILYNACTNKLVTLCNEEDPRANPAEIRKDMIAFALTQGANLYHHPIVEGEGEHGLIYHIVSACLSNKIAEEDGLEIIKYLIVQSEKSLLKNRPENWISEAIILLSSEDSSQSVTNACPEILVYLKEESSRIARNSPASHFA